MDENNNPVKKRLSEQLPTHSPDPGSWQHLSAKLDALDAESAYHEKLQQLPVHSPDKGTWKIIAYRLNRTAYVKLVSRIAMTAAAGLLLFFSVSRISDYYESKSGVPLVAVQEKPSGKLPSNVNPINSTAELRTTPGKRNNNTAPVPTTKNSDYIAVLFQDSIQTASEPETLLADKNSLLNEDLPAILQNEPESTAQNAIVSDKNLPVNNLLKPSPEPQASIMMKEQNAKPVLPPATYYTPKEPETSSSGNYFALSMNYLPENIDNGTDNSLFHNVDLTASYNKEKVRFNTSLGMAYNEEQLEFEMNYDIKSPVTATGSDGQIDTLGYNISNMDTEYQGTEKHQYFTYNLGIGRRIFKAGKFSTWFNAGAGLGIKLNDPDLVEATEKSIKNQYNATINSVNTSQLVYTDLNVSFITGIDFSYKIFNRLSITFSPTSRWYFKPVLTLNNQPTDELTLGFKTGMKFDF